MNRIARAYSGWISRYCERRGLVVKPRALTFVELVLIGVSPRRAWKAVRG